MAIQYPANRKEIVDRVKTDIQTELPDTAPFIRNSLLSSLATGFGGAAYDLYKTEQQLEYQMFPDTANGDYAVRWGSLKNITPKPATKAQGYINITGIAGSIIPALSELRTANAIGYTTNNSITIRTLDLSITSLTRSGSTATATTVRDHYYASGNIVIISGADQPEYNGSYVIVATGTNTFTYTITGTPVTPATGTIKATNTFANVEVTAIDYGTSSNLSSGSSMTFASPIPNVNPIAFVTETTIAGGSDNESDIEYRARYIYAYQHPISFFNDADIINTAFTVANVTRVFVHDIEPDVGQVTIYFMTDNTSSNGIPTPQDVTDVKNAILTIKPAHVHKDDIIVSAPIADVINFHLSSLSPDTNEMRDAIKENLKQMFLEQSQVGVTIYKEAYISAIQNSVDLSTGKEVESFALSTPTTDIATAPGHIAVFGDVT